MIRNIGGIIFQLVILWGINQLGYFIVSWTKLPLPGNVMGMLILIILLGTGIFPLSLIEKAATFLIKHLAFFFIPIAVGLIQFGDLFLEYGILLGIAITISALVGIYVTGFVTQFLSKRKGEKSL
ncbi:MULTISPECIES: CidA/LrgA family protein [Bacillaceae]|uniref:CidA/LrgA family protein n=1 Tax=Bacillaceae TaxID=186817 RepID=UPI001BA10502|nr:MULTISPECIES: CidA/LrgA family protein [Bacillaceae]UGB31889.1 CidA/LrgA family protein [Metabacillus sp. B2-18]UHA60166.1 CidA/LrgA family protein [Metabacillus litoralis]